MFRSIKKVVAGVAALAAVGLGSAALASATTSSSGATGSTGSTGSTAQTVPGGRGDMAAMPAHGTAAHEDAETTVTGADAAKAQAAAVKSVGGGTAGAVTTDYTHSGYEVTVTKTDGTSVEVHLDSSFNVMQGPGGHGGPPPLG